MNPNIERRFRDTDNSKTFQNIVRKFSLNKKTVLDIGCSYGEFLIHFGTGSTGITVSPEEVKYGVEEKGLDLRLGNVEDATFSLSSQYDVIFANNIFEHLYSPHHFLIKCRKFLKPEGKLILGVPSMPMILPLIKLPKFRGSLAAEHINFFTKDTLMKTVERGGWDVEVIRGFHFYSILIDKLFDPVYPHFYVVAAPHPGFQYHERRLRELRGYSPEFTIIP